MTKEMEIAVLEAAAKIERLKVLNDLMNLYEGKKVPMEIYEFVQRKSKVED